MIMRQINTKVSNRIFETPEVKYENELELVSSEISFNSVSP